MACWRARVRVCVCLCVDFYFWDFSWLLGILFVDDSFVNEYARHDVAWLVSMWWW